MSFERSPCFVIVVDGHLPLRYKKGAILKARRVGKDTGMRSTRRRATIFIIYLALALPGNTPGLPLPQDATKPANPAARPAQAPVMVIPAPMETGQLPPKEAIPADARKPDRILRVGHSRRVQALAFSLDGQWLASAGYDRTIIVWNLASGHEEFRLGRPADAMMPGSESSNFNKEAIVSLAFHPDGTHLVSLSVSGNVKMWHIKQRKLLYTIHLRRVHDYGGWITYSADGKSFIVAIENRTKDAEEAAIGFYDVQTGKSLRTIPTKWDLITALVQTSDGRLIASGSVGSDEDDDPSGSVQIFDANTGEPQKSYPVIASKFSPDGSWMGSFESAGVGHAVLWDVRDGKRVHDLSPQSGIHMVFRPDGQELALLHSNSNQIDFVSTPSGEVTKSLGSGGYGLGTAAYSADGKLLAAGSYGSSTIKVWDLGSMKEKVTLYGQSPVESVGFSPDGKLLAATSGELRIWDVASGAEVVTLTDAPVNRTAFSADGKWLAANPGGQFAGYAVKIWSTDTWQELASMPTKKGFPAFWLAFSDAKSAPPKIGNVQSRQMLFGEEAHILWGSALPMAISPDGSWLAQPFGGTGTVEIWDTNSGQKLQSIPAHQLAVGKLEFSPDGHWLISVGQDSNPLRVQGQPGVLISYPRVSVWNTVTWKLEFSVTFSSTTGADAVISRDGKLLVISRGGGATQLFDLEQKKPVAAFVSPDGRGGYVAISPDGATLAQGGQEGIRLWKLPASRVDLH